MGYVREYRAGDVESLAPRLRKRDQQEVAAHSGRDPLAALRHCATSSHILCTIVGDSGNVAGLYGVVPYDDLSGVIWLLGADELVQRPLRDQFLREGRQFLDPLHHYRPLLFNYVDERNTVHIRWLEWMGFTFINRHEKFGFEQRPFLEFVRLRHV